jgi:acid phosphatase
MQGARTLTALTGVFVLLVLLYSAYTRPSATQPQPSTPYASANRGSPLEVGAEALPFTAGWSSWFHPQSWILNAGRAGRGFETVSKKWNILYHLGGNGPWIQKVEGVVEGGIGPPDGCSVEQVHMMSRHAERYPTTRAGARMLNLVDRIKNPNITLKGPLAFVKDWEYFSSDPQANFEQLTNTGPYAGTLEAFATGVRLRTRYAHLFPSRLPPGGGKTSLWASDAGRVVDTARYFAAGFFGLDWKDTATLHVIPESPDIGGDTLTPGDTCLAYVNDTKYGHDQGAAKLVDFSNTYLPAIGKRLEYYVSTSEQEAFESGFHFANDEIYALQEMCGFETIVRGTSPWCGVFTHDEWRSFEYARDIIHFYRAGPGTKYSAAMGSLWLNATARLLTESDPGPFFMSL